jgi:hypothetical protein
MSAEAIERIRELRAEGLTLARVADELNRTGIATPTGRGRWHPAGISRALAVRDAT